MMQAFSHKPKNLTKIVTKKLGAKRAKVQKYKKSFEEKLLNI